MRRITGVVGASVAMFMSTVSLTAAASAGGSAEAYLFTYFTGNGESGLHLAWSEDGST